MNQKRTTPFRANEAALAEREKAVHFYCRNFRDPALREASTAYIDKLIERFGPVVDGYPSWHPFTAIPQSEAESKQGHAPNYEPYGIDGLNHTIFFRAAFVTAPYGGAERVMKSVEKRRDYYIDAEEITDVTLYNEGATPVLVTCGGIDKEPDGTIAKRYALGRMLATELPAWEWAKCGESWETMRRYFLGTPCGSRSSLFVNQDTGQALKEVFELLNRHELFGPLRK